jgi:hypothetical protein
MKQLSAKFPKNESELTTIIQRVRDNTENNPLFPNPPAALAELAKVQAEFQVARANAQGGDKTMVSIKNDKKALVLGLLQEIADYVTVTSKGDKTIILSSGFDVTGKGNYAQSPSIGKFEVEAVLPGEVNIRVNQVAGVKAYVHQYTTEPPGINAIWVGEGTSLNTYTFQGLQSDKRYWFRVLAIGYNGQRSYTPVVSRVIQ